MSRIKSLKTKTLIILFSFVLLALGSAMAQSASVQPWNNVYGGIRTQDSFNYILNTSDGGYAAVGFTYPQGSNVSDAWLVKIDNNGNELWNETYGGPNDSVGYSAVQTADGGYAIAGYTSSYSDTMKMLLIRTDSNGNLLWNKTYGYDMGASAYTVAKTPDGGFILGGWLYSNVSGWDMYLVRTDANGNMLWNRTYGGMGKDLAHYISPTSDGGYIITGSTKSYGHGTGGGNLFGQGAEDVWLLKTDAQGNEQWNHTYGGYDYDDGYAVLEAADGGYVIAGTTYSFDNKGTPIKAWSPTDVGEGYVLHTDALGNLTWYKLLTGYNNMTLFSMTRAQDGYTVGGTCVDASGNAKFFAAEMTFNGSLVWSDIYGGSKNDYCYSIVPATDGGYILAGNSNSFSLDGSLKGYLMRIDENGGFSTTIGGSSPSSSGANGLVVPIAIISVIVIVLGIIIGWRMYTKK